MKDKKVTVIDKEFETKTKTFSKYLEGYGKFMDSFRSAKEEEKNNEKLIEKKGRVEGEVVAVWGVCIDLMDKGYEIFKNVCQDGSCDLVAIKDGKIYRVKARVCSSRKARNRHAFHN